MIYEILKKSGWYSERNINIEKYLEYLRSNDYENFYGGCDDFLIKLGDDFKNSLLNLINGNNLNAELVDLIDID